jgi:hypothetical protein
VSAGTTGITIGGFQLCICKEIWACWSTIFLLSLFGICESMSF